MGARKAEQVYLSVDIEKRERFKCVSIIDDICMNQNGKEGRSTFGSRARNRIYTFGAHTNIHKHLTGPFSLHSYQNIGQYSNIMPSLISQIEQFQHFINKYWAHYVYAFVYADKAGNVKPHENKHTNKNVHSMLLA